MSSNINPVNSKGGSTGGKKPELNPSSQQQPTHILRQPVHIDQTIRSHFQASLKSSGITSQIASNIRSSLGYQTQINRQPQTLVPKLTVMGNQVDTQAAQLQAAQQGGHSSLNAVPINLSSSQTGRTLTTQVQATPAQPVQIRHTTPLHPQVMSGGTTQQVTVPMASIIKGASVQVSQHPSTQAYATHLPRGAAQVSNLTNPKGVTLATAVLHPSQPSIVLPTKSSSSNVMPTPIQPRGSFVSTNLRPVTPPINRTVVPAASSSSISTDAHRAHIPSTTTTTVQITIQQPRTLEPRTNIDIIPRAVSGSQQINKPMQLNQTHVINQQLQPQQKIVMSQQTVSSLPQQIIKTVLPQLQNSSVHQGSAPVVTTISAPAIPIAKVHPQRQMSQDSRDLSHDTRTTQSGLGTIFQGQGHRGSPGLSTGVSTATTNVHTDIRSDSRSQISQQVGQQYQDMQHFATYATYGNTHPTLANLPLGYNPLSYSPAVAHAFAQGVRQSIVPNTQSPNLATALQSQTISSSPRLQSYNNPMMVAVDPTRSPLAVHSQYAPTSIQTQVTDSASHTSSGGLSNQPIANPSASPRPSILRKRTLEGTLIDKVKKVLTPTGSETSSPMQELAPRTLSVSPTKPGPPLDPARENSQSSTDTATSNETGLGDETVKIKTEPDLLENGPISNGLNNNSVEMSPRKKPRKQLLSLLHGIEGVEGDNKPVLPTPYSVRIKDEIKDSSSTDSDIEKDEDIDTTFDEKDELPEEYTDDEGVRWVRMRKRFSGCLLTNYHCNWKARNNHFVRYVDVKPKDERRPTVNELSNQKGIGQKASGWRLYHLAAQLEDMADSEKNVRKKLKEIQAQVAPKSQVKHLPLDDDVTMVHELTQGNIQRCQLVIEQLEEARDSMLGILGHKSRIMEIVTKHHSKRPVKKKERS
ncbi:unnamed protein product [Owenia fusiformis]|uniref:Histone deacetylase complex subunit SAP130 C-terminal domain-containing protein n=1 Tax=Owenia fusiformis TaxID=6347 RepID=A0A8S4NNP0_OWEFU|nr:unnamed protein product [Owenia fusiformis]